MPLQLYLAFVALESRGRCWPGPMVTLLIANGPRHGTRAALINIAGAQLGLAIVIGVVAVGLSHRGWRPRPAGPIDGLLLAAFVAKAIADLLAVGRRFARSMRIARRAETLPAIN
jgi:hypothetical protein